MTRPKTPFRQAERFFEMVEKDEKVATQFNILVNATVEGNLWGQKDPLKKILTQAFVRDGKPFQERPGERPKGSAHTMAETMSNRLVCLASDAYEGIRRSSDFSGAGEQKPILLQDKMKKLASDLPKAQIKNNYGGNCFPGFQVIVIR
ncbi:MAG: hypothetical protein K9G62_04560 [Alphaproteobacteria bacterium]|nr:hypothetical protein [Alphaproteobacteria bacterium]